MATELATNVFGMEGAVKCCFRCWTTALLLMWKSWPSIGEGMKDVERCLRDGFSTAGTPGTGLGAVRRLSALFDIFSAAGRGTVAVSRVGRKGDERMASAASLECGAVCVALEGETECGDTWRVADGDARSAILVADGLGHGALAATPAQDTAGVFAERPFEEPAGGMQALHRKLAGGRGAVAAWAVLHREDSRLEYAGVGNITGSIVAKERSQGMVSFNGILGVQVSRIRQFSYNCPADSLVVMHSDGLSARWRLADHPGLHGRHASVIAGVLYRESARKRDDVTVVIVRHGP